MPAHQSESELCDQRVLIARSISTSVAPSRSRLNVSPVRAKPWRRYRRSARPLSFCDVQAQSRHIVVCCPEDHLVNEVVGCTGTANPGIDPHSDQVRESLVCVVADDCHNPRRAVFR
jgi:hypothetical protein